MSEEVPSLMRGWSRWRLRLLHLWFLFSRPATLGVRGLVIDRAAGSVLLVRHTYVRGWMLPGGGVDAGESAHAALTRELREEANIVVTGAAALRSFHHNKAASRRDHVAFYVVENWRQEGQKTPDREIAEAAFFSLEALPAGTTAATRRRIAEFRDDLPAPPEW